MIEDMIFVPNIFQPEDALALRKATHLAINKAGGAVQINETDQRVLAGCVLRLAQRGYTRTPGGALDSESLAQAAFTRFCNRS